jgi:hypothetical protein
MTTVGLRRSVITISVPQGGTKMTRRRTIRPHTTVATFACAALLVSACGGEQSAEQQTRLEQQQPEASQAVVQAPTAKPATTIAHLPRPLRALLTDLYALDGLTATQRKGLDTLQVKVRTQTVAWRSMHAAALEDAAKQVRAGRLDQASIEGHVKKMHTAMKDKARPLLIASLDELHRTLSADQRRQLVGKLKARFDARKSPREKMRKMADKLGLDQAQRDQIRAVLIAQFGGKLSDHAAKRREHRARMRAAAQAFIADDFKASELHFAKAPKKKLRDIQLKIAGAKGVFDSLLPILTSAQREVIATLLEQKAAKVRLAALLK